jgi:GNAT superfamily N-acetyltransferase
MNGVPPFWLAQAEVAQLPEVAAVITEAFHTSDPWLGWLSPLIRLGIYQDLRQRLLVGTSHYACFISGISHLNLTKILGTVEINLRSIPELASPSLTFPYLSNLAVRSSHRRQGIAEQLLLTCEQTVLGWGYRDLYLHAMEDNQAAIGLYQKLGYRLRQTENSWGYLLWRQPRQLLLHKSLAK